MFSGILPRLGIALVGIVLVFGAFKWAYEQGKNVQRAEQEQADTEYRERVLEELKDAGVDLNDPDAVERFLHGLSGAE